MWSVWSVGPMFVAWSLADMSRLSWYIATMLGREVYVLTWLRCAAAHYRQK